MSSGASIWGGFSPSKIAFEVLEQYAEIVLNELLALWLKILFELRTGRGCCPKSRLGDYRPVQAPTLHPNSFLSLLLCRQQWLLLLIVAVSCFF